MDFKWPKTMPAGRQVDVCGVKVEDISFSEAVFKILKLAKDEKGKHLVVTINSEFVMLARKNRRFKKILNEADLALADGAWVVFSKRIFGGKIHERITGVDLVEKICAKSAKEAVKIGFLGAFGGVAKVVAKRQKAKNLGLVVVYARPGDPAIGQDLRLRKAISAVGRIDILFVAYGMGRQEFWIDRNRKHLNVGVFMGVGGAFDYLSMVKKRAPKVMQDLGFEWLWRLMMEPARIRRMAVLPIFLLLVVETWFLRKWPKNA